MIVSQFALWCIKNTFIIYDIIRHIIIHTVCTYKTGALFNALIMLSHEMKLLICYYLFSPSCDPHCPQPAYCHPFPHWKHLNYDS